MKYVPENEMEAEESKILENNKIVCDFEVNFCLENCSNFGSNHEFQTKKAYIMEKKKEDEETEKSIFAKGKVTYKDKEIADMLIHGKNGCFKPKYAKDTNRLAELCDKDKEKILQRGLEGRDLYGWDVMYSGALILENE